jgi:hypothetical protein
MLHNPSSLQLSVLTSGYAAILGRYEAGGHVFLTNGPNRMPNWIEVLAGAVCHPYRPLHQKPAEA